MNRQRPRLLECSWDRDFHPSKQDSTVTLTAERLHAARAQIQQLYLHYKLPWIVGLTQGKDSTAGAQLIWEAIAALPPDQRVPPSISDWKANYKNLRQ